MQETYSWPLYLIFNNHFSAEYVDVAEIKTTLETFLTTWTEWSSCSPYCQQSRHRVCSGGFQCFDDDGDSTILCTGNGLVMANQLRFQTFMPTIDIREYNTEIRKYL